MRVRIVLEIGRSEYEIIRDQSETFSAAATADLARAELDDAVAVIKRAAQL